MNNLGKRKSIRKYSGKAVSEALLTSLLQQAERTPTMGNLQLYSVVVTRDDAMKRQLAPAHFSQPMVTGAPVVLTFCADFRRTSLWAKNRNAVPGYDNLLSFINAATDTLLYCQTFCNLSEEAGLGTCFLGTTVYQPMSIIKLLKLPKLVFPVATITLVGPTTLHKATACPSTLFCTVRPITTTRPNASMHATTTRSHCPKTNISLRSTTKRRWRKCSLTSDTRRRIMRLCRKDSSKL